MIQTATENWLNSVSVMQWCENVLQSESVQQDITARCGYRWLNKLLVWLEQVKSALDSLDRGITGKFVSPIILPTLAKLSHTGQHSPSGVTTFSQLDRASHCTSSQMATPLSQTQTRQGSGFQMSLWGWISPSTVQLSPLLSSATVTQTQVIDFITNSPQQTDRINIYLSWVLLWELMATPGSSTRGSIRHPGSQFSGSRRGPRTPHPHTQRSPYHTHRSDTAPGSTCRCWRKLSHFLCRYLHEKEIKFN